MYVCTMCALPSCFIRDAIKLVVHLRIVVNTGARGMADSKEG